MMSDAIVIPISAESEPRATRQLSPLVLGYLKSISSGERRLSEAQAAELAAAPHDGQFLQYMISSDSDASNVLAPIDCSRPLSNYFINTSHNTYLTGNQLYGEASTSPYSEALLDGCRCIEIDVWDGEEKPTDGGQRKTISSDEDVKQSHRHTLSAAIKDRLHITSAATAEGQTAEAVRDDELQMPAPWQSAPRAEPRVLHGHTLTKEVPFREVCNAIMRAAFVKSPLPVIVSLEVHAKAEQQAIMVEIIKTAFKGHLLPTPTDEDLTLPSPESLLNKILIKVKYVSPKKGSGDQESKRSDKKVKLLGRPKASNNTGDTSASTSDNDAPSARLESAKKKKKASIIPTLSALGIYTRSYHFHDLASPEALVPTHVFSLSEKKLMEIHQSSGPSLFSHNRNFLMRAYPSGLRVRSDNLDPAVFWRKGVQMVALNRQRWDEGMMLNQAMFEGSGGWILKPQGYLGIMKASSLANPGPQLGDIRGIGSETQAESAEYKTLNLCLTIFVAQDVPIPDSLKGTHSIRPYLKIELHVEKPEERSGAPIENDGRSMEEEEGKFKHTLKTKAKGPDIDLCARQVEFHDITGVVGPLSFVRIKIQNDERFNKDPLMAWACIRLDRLKTGYRFVHLKDSNGLASPGRLLIHIEKSLT